MQSLAGEFFSRAVSNQGKLINMQILGISTNPPVIHLSTKDQKDKTRTLILVGKLHGHK